MNKVECSWCHGFGGTFGFAGPADTAEDVEGKPWVTCNACGGAGFVDAPQLPKLKIRRTRIESESISNDRFIISFADLKHGATAGGYEVLRGRQKNHPGFTFCIYYSKNFENMNVFYIETLSPDEVIEAIKIGKEWVEKGCP